MAVRQGIRLKDHTILALNIGSRFIKVAELRLNKGMISLLNVAVRPTPANMLNPNQILDPVGLGRAIKEMLVTDRIKSKKVVVAVSGQSSVVVRPIDLPKMGLKELADTMKFEVERHIPFTADEVVMDYAPLVEPDELPETETNMKVLLAVAQEELIKAYIKVVQVAGLQPVAMDVEILSTIRSLIDIHAGSTGYEETIALVSIGAVSTDISIVDKGKIIFTRSVPIAGDTLTEAIADQLGRDFDESEELKKELGFVFLEPGAGVSMPGEEAPHPPDAYAAPGAAGLNFPADAGPAPTAFFPLDDSVNTHGMPDSGAPPAPSSSPLFGVEDAPAIMPFSFDDDVDDDVPILRLSDEEEDEQHPIPTFRLDSDDVDDDVPIPPALAPEPAATASTGPVFDLSSELENQLPTPLARPTPAPAEEAPPAPAVTVGTPAAQQTPAAAPPTLIDPFAPPASAAPPADAAYLPPPLFTPAEAKSAAPAVSGTTSQEGVFQRRIFDAMLPTLLELVAEVRRSLEYYASREPETPVQRVIIYGGTSRLPNLAKFFSHEIGLDVKNADPIAGLDLSAFFQPQDYLQDLAPALPVCIGLGLRDMIE